MKQLLVIGVLLMPLWTSAQLTIANVPVATLHATCDFNVQFPMSNDQFSLLDTDELKRDSKNVGVSLMTNTDANKHRYQPKHYGFFCRVESKIEKKSLFSPRFRLGSTEYVNALEGKD